MNIKRPFSAPLNPKDSETETYGCRSNNPDICKYNGLPGRCAFENEDYICRNPSKAWRKLYHKVKDL